MKILHTADIHIGNNTYGRIDARTGLNSRLLDFRRCFEFMVARGLREDIDVFLFCGDAYRTATPSPTQQKTFAECLRPVAEAGIPIVMITGNHDHPISFGKASSIDIFKYLSGDVHVFRKPESARIETRSGPLQLVAMPWPVRSLLLLGNKYRKVSPKQLSEVIEKMYTDIIAREAAKLDPLLPAVLAGHFSVAGSLTKSSERGSLMFNEPKLSPAQLSPAPIDYVALGHIHHHQNCAPEGHTPVVYSGSIERITFNEQGSRKGFVLVTITGNPKKTSSSFVETPARRFATVHVDARNADDPTEAIVRKIARSDVKDAIVRVLFQINESQRALVNLNRVRAALKPAFSIASIERVSEPVERRQRTLVTRESSMKEALGSYIDQHSHLAPMKDALIRKALALEAELAG